MSLKKIPWFVMLVVLYFPLTLLAGNVGEVDHFAANRVIVFLLFAEILLLAILKWIYKDWQRVGFAAFLLTILMLSYGHVYSLLDGVEYNGLVIGRHRYLIIVWVALGTLSFYLTSTVKQFSTFEMTAKLVSIALVMFTLMRLATFYYLEWRVAQEQVSIETNSRVVQDGMTEKTPPDVYYIILDAYGRSDILKDDFEVDTTDFLNSLRSMGFFIADCSQSNYAHTRLSLATSLNYNYLEELGQDFIPGSTDWADLAGLIRNSRVRRVFEGKNYQVVAFETGYAWTEWRDVDLYIENESTFFSKHLSSFENLFLHTTIGAVILDLEWFPEYQKNIQHYELILSNLDTLENLANTDNPMFVFAHLVVPHHPFVFDKGGGYKQDQSLSPAFENYTDEEYYNGYRQQVIFINDRILNIVEAILSNSDRPPIIVIQGDHGPSHAGEKARMSILNVYYLPDIPNNQLDIRITPVNTFRVILNSYFGQDLPILPDISYFSKNSDPYAYTVIPNECEP